MRTVELGHILSVFLQNVHLHGATLCETGVTDVALVWLLACNKEERLVIKFSLLNLKINHILQLEGRNKLIT